MRLSVLVLVLAFAGAPALAKAPPTFLLSWSPPHAGAGSACIAVDGEGAVYVLNLRVEQIQKFNPDGGGGPLQPGDGQFLYPTDLDVDHLNRVFVLDPGTGLVQVFDSGGVFLAKWAYRDPAPQLSATDRIAVDGNGTVTIWIEAEKRLARFTAAGRPLLDMDRITFDGVLGLDTDGDNDLYVSDFYGNRVFHFDSAGLLLTQWGSEGGDNHDLRPSGVAVDDTRHLLYVLDYYLVQKFAEAAVPVKPTTWSRVKTTYD